MGERARWLCEGVFLVWVGLPSGLAGTTGGLLLGLGMSVMWAGIVHRVRRTDTGFITVLSRLARWRGVGDLARVCGGASALLKVECATRGRVAAGDVGWVLGLFSRKERSVTTVLCVNFFLYLSLAHLVAKERAGRDSLLVSANMAAITSV